MSLNLCRFSETQLDDLLEGVAVGFVITRIVVWLLNSTTQ